MAHSNVLSNAATETDVILATGLDNTVDSNVMDALIALSIFVTQYIFLLTASVTVRFEQRLASAHCAVRPYNVTWTFFVINILWILFFS